MFFDRQKVCHEKLDILNGNWENLSKFSKLRWLRPSGQDTIMKAGKFWQCIKWYFRNGSHERQKWRTRFLKQVKKTAHSMALKPIKWRQCVDNQRPPLGEQRCYIQTPAFVSWSWYVDRFCDVIRNVSWFFCDHVEWTTLQRLISARILYQHSIGLGVLSPKVNWKCFVKIYIMTYPARYQICNYSARLGFAWYILMYSVFCKRFLSWQIKRLVVVVIVYSIPSR